MAVPETAADSGGPAVRLGKYEILPGATLAELRSPHADAFAAVDQERGGDDLFALVGESRWPVRHELIEPLAALRPKGMLVPVAWGVVDWHPEARRRFAFIYGRPPGSRVIASLSETIEPFAEEDVLTLVLPSLSEALRRFFTIGHTHRAIRPDNLFYGGTADRRLVLGECLSEPPALSQPIAFETIESALARPAGRGPGSPADDLYALGVTLLFLLIGHDPAEGMAADQLLEEKIRRGSYATLLGTARLQPRAAEAIRGLLADDVRERWTMKELDFWASGRKLVPKICTPPRRAARALDFCGIGHFTARSLADALTREPEEAGHLIKSQEFEAWLQHSLAETELAGQIATTIADTPQGEGATHQARLIARVTMALDPLAPIRYDGASFAVDGFGSALAEAVQSGGAVPTFADAINGRLPQFWFAQRGGYKLENAPRIKLFDRLRQHLEDRRPGFGIERMLYELNPGLHCLAPAIERDHVVDASDLLGALERAAANGTLGDSLIDRHVAAFAAARFRQAGVEWHEMLANGDPHQRAFGALHLLARLQSQHGPAAVPSLASRLGNELPALLERFHSRSRRTRLRTQIAKSVSKGDLANVLALLAGPTERRQDEADFMLARAEFSAIERSLAVLRAEEQSRPQQADELGGRLGSMVACVVGALASVAVIFAAG